MNELEKLVESASKLCASLEAASANEKAFSEDVCLELERMSWNTLKMRNDLQKLKEYMQ